MNNHPELRPDRLLRVLALLVLVALLAVACGGDGDTAAPDDDGDDGDAEPADDQLSLAEEEGKVVWYAGLQLGLVESISEAFEEKTGIQVDAIRLGGEQVVTRVLQEDEAGIGLADVIYTGNEGNFISFKEEGILAPYESVEIGAFDEAYYDADHHYYVPYANRFLIAYNNEIVSEDEAPTSYADLADSRWEGQLTVSHAGFSVGAAIVPYFWAQIPELGLEHMGRIAANDPMVTQSLHDGIAAVIAGERQVAVIVNDAGIFSVLEGNPITVVFPEEGVPTANGGVGIAASAPHPNAARELLDFILSQEGQQIMADDFRTVFRDDVEYPEGYIPPDEDQNLQFIDPVDFAEMHEEIRLRFEEEYGV